MDIFKGGLCMLPVPCLINSWLKKDTNSYALCFVGLHHYEKVSILSILSLGILMAVIYSNE